MAETTTAISLFVDAHPQEASLKADVLSGLRQAPRMLPPRLFYDREGSLLFDRITRLEEYYPTRTELSILEGKGAEMAARVGAQATVIEYGSGSSEKTRTLLRLLDRPKAYVPIDISKEHLLEAAGEITERFPELNVLPVCADYHQEIPELVRLAHREHAFVFFPGSTIGNFEEDEARDFLKQIAHIVGEGGGLLIGVDLVKPAAILQAAYNDAEGVTAEFNLNMLHHINRRLGPVFDVDAWRHQAVWDAGASRIEMRLIAQSDQTVRIDGEAFEFRTGEWITTEYSHKYTVQSFEALAAGAGFDLVETWMDDQQLFSVHYCVARGA